MEQQTLASGERVQPVPKSYTLEARSMFEAAATARQAKR